METFQPFLLSPTLLQRFSANIKEQLEQWLFSSTELSLFVSGRTGGGKSTLVNALLGSTVAKEGAEPDPTTTKVTCYVGTVSNVRVKVWDSPGLQDGTNNEARYLNDIADRCTHVDLFLFCINVGDAIRFNSDSPEVKALVKLTEKLGPTIWNHAIIALTFANELGQTSREMKLAERRNDKDKVKDLFCQKVQQWKQFLLDILAEIGLSSDQIQKLKIVPTGHRREPALPDRSHWLSTFWFEALRSTHPRAQPALLRMNENRIIENTDTVDEKTLSQHSEDQAFIFSDFGGDVGRLIFGSEYLGSITGLAMADFKEMKLKEQIVLEQFLIMKTIEQQRSLGGPVSHNSGEGVEGDWLESPMDVPFLQKGLQPPTTAPPASVPSSTPDSSELEATEHKDSLQKEENVSLASSKSGCGGHPYRE